MAEIQGNVREIYRTEREKRLAENSIGMRQYLDLDATIAVLEGSKKDPWLDDEPLHKYHSISDEGYTKYLIIGAGFSGISIAVKLLQRGVKVKELLIVDSAGGFGGTWYWNRYPGLMCDIESYIYLPLLEETEYMPTRKYASGEEIRHYSNLLAKQFGLPERAMFQTTARSLRWNATDAHWDCILSKQSIDLRAAELSITADFVVVASGLFQGPKIPDVPGLKSFGGHFFHTYNWDYSFTGGSPAEPVLDKLIGKNVGFVGTGATAIQVIPEVARYARRLYVFQRTASAVDVRGQKDTDPTEWKEKIASKKGWWIERNENFHSHSQDEVPSPAENLVDDGFTRTKSYACVFGSPKAITPDNLQQWTERMYALDLPRSERLRQRAKDAVNDAEIGRKLQAWYPGWCKRPCFHDEYLSTFNQPSVHLIDTGDGRGIVGVTDKGIKAGDQEYPVDLIIWGTGYVSPLTGSMVGRAGIEVVGESEASMEQRALDGNLDTLHGCIAPDFPNLLYMGVSQCGIGPNQTHRIDVVSTHIAYILTEAIKKVSGRKPVIRATEQAAHAWAQQVASVSLSSAPMLDCTPSFYNLEGDSYKFPDEVKKKLARNGFWGRGMNDFAKVCAKWRMEGNMLGLEVNAI